LKDFNTLYDEHSSELICHVSAIENINQSLISEEKEINRILTKKEERFEKIKKLLLTKEKRL
jgi:fumarate hydratase class II